MTVPRQGGEDAFHMTAVGRRKLEEALGSPITDADLKRAGWTYEPRGLGDGYPGCSACPNCGSASGERCRDTPTRTWSIVLGCVRP